MCDISEIYDHAKDVYLLPIQKIRVFSVLFFKFFFWRRHVSYFGAN